jgi:monoamine oxidase
LGPAVVERGAEFVLDGYDVMRELCGRFGLEVADTGMSYYVREPRGGRPTTADAMTEAAYGLSAAVAGARSAASVTDVLDELELDSAVVDSLLARIEISCAHEARGLSAAVLDHVASFEPLPSARVVGGNQLVANRLAESFGAAVHLSTPVRRIQWSESGVVARTDVGEVVGDRAVLAVPLPVLAEMYIEPALPEVMREALTRAAYGHAAKLQVPLRETTAPSAVMSTPGRYWSWTLTAGETDVVLPAVHCFAGSPAALDRLEVTSGPGAWLADLTELRPELALHDEGALLTSWSDDPWARGAYSALAVGSLPGDETLLATPMGPMHFAGEWTAGAWSGLMEGALRSGRRTASEILATGPVRDLRPTKGGI